MPETVVGLQVWGELLDAMGRQDPLGYLRTRCAQPLDARELCTRLAAERRAVVGVLAGDGSSPTGALEHDIETFYVAVTAEAFRWSTDGRVWPWPAQEAMAVPVPQPLGLLRDSTHRILAELELKRLLPLLVERAAALTRADAAFLALADPLRGTLELIESRGLVGPVPRELAVDTSTVVALLDGQAAVLLDAHGTSWLAPLAQGDARVLVAPLWHQAELLGVIACRGANEATGRDVLAMLADLTAIAIRNAAYYREIHHKAADLQVANEQLRDLDRVKDLFLATVSHELRTPLNFIMGFGSILLDGEEVPPLLEEQRELLAKVMEGAHLLLDLVNDLLDYSRIRAGHLAMALDVLSPGPWLDELLDGFGSLAASRGLVVVRDVPAGLPAIEGDRQRLAQVMRNLLANALKFTPPGGEVTVRACAMDGKLRIEVADTGVGVPPQDHDRLFEQFSQIDSRQDGTGLGLAISKSLVEAHGGRIGVVSPRFPEKPFGAGAGSIFWWEIAAAD